MMMAVQILFGVTLLAFIAATIYGLVMLDKVRKEKARSTPLQREPRQ